MIKRCFLLLILGAMATATWAVEAKKLYEIPFDYEILPFFVDGKPAAWDLEQGCLFIYDRGKLFRKQPMPRGEGPGEFKTLQNIVFDGTHYHAWDKLYFRMSLYSVDWKLIKTVKMTSMRLFGDFTGIMDGRYVFRWATLSTTPAKTEVTEHLGFVDEKKMIPWLDFPKGDFRTGKVANFSRPYPIMAVTGNTVYHAVNTRYRVSKMTLVKGRLEPMGVIERMVTPVKLTEKLKNLQNEVLSGDNRWPPGAPKNIYSKYLPPLIDLAADGDLLAVVTNQKLLQKKAKVDIFKNGAYKGSIEIPCIYYQYFLFPSALPGYFPSGTHLKDNQLFTFHYDEEDDQYKIICHRITL